jgi:hypothetical protein
VLGHLAAVGSGSVPAGRLGQLADAGPSSLGQLGQVALALAAAAVLAGAYWLSLRLWPYGPCLACGGSGRSWGSNKRRHGICRACRGSGRRTRLGARILGTIKHGRR